MIIFFYCKKSNLKNISDKEEGNEDFNDSEKVVYDLEELSQLVR